MMRSMGYFLLFLLVSLGAGGMLAWSALGRLKARQEPTALDTLRSICGGRP